MAVHAEPERSYAEHEDGKPEVGRRGRDRGKGIEGAASTKQGAMKIARRCTCGGTNADIIIKLGNGPARHTSCVYWNAARARCLMRCEGDGDAQPSQVDRGQEAEAPLNDNSKSSSSVACKKPVSIAVSSEEW